MVAEGIDPKYLRVALLEILTFLGASARGLIDEPKLYGSLRLIEAAQRVINIMDRLNVSDTELNSLAGLIIDDAMKISLDKNYCMEFSDEITIVFAGKLRDA